MSGVFVGCPTKDGLIDHECALRLFKEASKVHDVIVKVQTGFITTMACTRLWADALNVRDSTRHEDGHGVEWFALLHCDVVPEAWWIDRLIALAEDHDADLVSAVVPLKGDRGLTSTALAHPENPGLSCTRLTLRQLHCWRFPKTFDAESATTAIASLPDDLCVRDVPEGAHLLANTGCMVCRINRPWCGNVWFSVVDRMFHSDGMWQTSAFPDDWGFTRNVALQGGKVVVTTDVKTVHIGGGRFSSGSSGGISRDDGVFN